MPLAQTPYTDQDHACGKLNQFGDYDDVTNMTVKDWDDRWARQQTKFHVPKEHPMLIKHIDRLTLKKQKQRIFVPLCGKSIDMKWLAENGHEVVGNEAVDEGCRLFFEEQQIPCAKEPLAKINGSLYKATDKNSLTIYQCDCFDLNSDVLGTFDCIWDRGAFVALPVKERQRYASLMKSLMKKDCRYLLDTFLVDNEKFGGPPFNCTSDDVNTYFGDQCTIEKLDEKDAFGKWQQSWGVTYFTEEVYLLRPKSLD